jgi:hypothetical protein
MAPSETKAVTLSLDPGDLAIHEVAKDDWELVPGEYKVYVGDSSTDLPLTGTIAIRSSSKLGSAASPEESGNSSRPCRVLRDSSADRARPRTMIDNISWEIYT